MGRIKGYQFITYEWCMVTWTALLVFLRIYIRVHVRGGLFHLRSWKMSDVFVLIGWMGFITQAAIDSTLNDRNWFNPDAAGTQPESAFHTYFFRAMVYWTDLYWVKLSMLFFYTEFVMRTTMFKTWCLVIASMVLIVGSIITTLCIIIFGCNPASIWWTNPFGNTCDLYDNNTWISIVGNLQMFTDILVWIIPFCVLPDLSKRHRKGVALMFSMGFLCVLCSINSNILLLIGVVGKVQLSPTIYTIRNVSIILEQGVGISVACLPGFRGFLTHHGIVEKLSFFSSRFSGRSASAKSKGSASPSSGDSSVPTKGTPAITEVATVDFV